MPLLVRSCSGLASALAVVTTLARAAGVDDATKSLLVADYGLRCAAALHPSAENRVRMSAVMSPDFMLIKTTGRPSDQGDLIDYSIALSQNYRVTACSYNVRSFVQSDPDTIIVTSDLKMRGKLHGPDDHQVTADQQAQDTWIRSAQTWLLRLTVVSSILIKVDGNVLQDIHS